MVIELVGHRESVGHKLVTQAQAKSLEDQLVDQLKAATARQLMEEWDLAALSLRTMGWLEDSDKVGLTDKLSEHLVEDGFVLTLLRTAVNYVRYNGHAEKRIFWDELVSEVGQGIADAVDRLSCSPLSRNLSEEDQDTVALGQKYASGWRPKAWHES